MSKRRETNSLKRRNFDKRMDNAMGKIRRIKLDRSASIGRIECDCCGKWLSGFTAMQLTGKVSAKLNQGHPITCSKSCKTELKNRV